MTQPRSTLVSLDGHLLVPRRLSLRAPRVSLRLR